MTRGRRRHQNSWSLPVAIVIVLLALASGVSNNSNGDLSAALLGLSAVALFVGLLALLFLLYKSARQRQSLRLLGLAEVDTMPGIAFERWVGEQLRLRGYSVRFTPINDYGVDIVASKDGVKTAVQVKRYKRPLDQKPIREAVAGMLQYHCGKSMVVTNSTFTPAAKVLARSNHCELVDRTALAEWLSRKSPNA